LPDGCAPLRNCKNFRRPVAAFRQPVTEKASVSISYKFRGVKNPDRGAPPQRLWAGEAASPGMAQLSGASGRERPLEGAAAAITARIADLDSSPQDLRGISSERLTLAPMRRSPRGLYRRERIEAAARAGWRRPEGPPLRHLPGPSRVRWRSPRLRVFPFRFRPYGDGGARFQSRRGRRRRARASPARALCRRGNSAAAGGKPDRSA